MNAVKAKVLAALQRFHVFRGDAVDPGGHGGAVLLDVGIHPARETGENPVDLRINLIAVFDHGLLRAQQTLQVIAVPAIFVRDESQVPVAERWKALALPLAAPGRRDTG